MKIAFKYGAIIAVVGIVIGLLSYLLGLHDDLSRMETANTVTQVVTLIVSLTFMLLAMRAVRAASPDSSLSYGRAVGTGTLVSLFSGLLTAPYLLLYGLVINPEYHELIYQQTIAEMTQEQADAAEGMMRFFTGPIWLAAMAVVMSPIIGALISLILGLFVRRAPQAAAVPAATA
jgi:hypothetical protein